MEECYARALRFLSRAEHCRQGLERKLLQRGYSQTEVRQALEKLQEEGALNDRRYAEAWVRGRLRRHSAGRTLLEKELNKRGVEKELCREVALRASSWPEYQEAKQRAYQEILRRGIHEKSQITAELRRKGYTFYEIRLLFEDFG